MDVRLFGRFEVTSPDGLSLGLNCAKSRELLAYLLLHRDRAHRREAVADRLWGQITWRDPRKTLRQALWQLQTVLAAKSNGELTPIEALDPEWVRVDPSVAVALDVADFERAWSQVEKWSRGENSNSRAPEIIQALEIYRGELLEGEDWGWCTVERRRLRSMFLVMSDRITGWCMHRGEYELGVRVATATLRDDPAREKTHRRLMRLHAHAGDRTSALRQYETCVAALRTELDVEPSRQTRELYERIRTDRVIAIDGGDLPVGGEHAVPSQASTVLEDIRRLRDLLDRTRQEVTVKIEALERALEREKQAGKSTG